jgi:YggT family protein
MGGFYWTAWVIARVFDVLMLIILVNALLSWIHPRPNHPVVHVLERISDALCNPVRRAIPTVFGGMDISPMIVMLLLVVVRNILVRVLAG